MKYYVDSSSGICSYMQLYRQIRADIEHEIYKYGEKIPSKRMLSEETGVSVITVQHAYEILCDEGYVESRERSGYFVAYRKEGFLPISERETEPASPGLSLSDESFPLSVFSKTMRSVISKYGERILIKCPNAGSPELREAICAYLQKSKGMNVKPEQIVIGSGAEYLYGLIVNLLGRDRIYGIENPSYEKIRRVYEANGVSCDLLPLGGDGILSSALRRTKASVLHITPFCSFPSGVTASVSKRKEYIRFAKERNGIIIEDDFNSEFTVSRKYEETVFSLEPFQHVIYVNTFSKTIAPSVRVGYMVLPTYSAEQLLHKIDFYSCTVPVFDQLVLAELLNSGDFERHINRIRRKRRQMLKKSNSHSHDIK